MLSTHVFITYRIPTKIDTDIMTLVLGVHAYVYNITSCNHALQLKESKARAMKGLIS